MLLSTSSLADRWYGVDGDDGSPLTSGDCERTAGLLGLMMGTGEAGTGIAGLDVLRPIEPSLGTDFFNRSKELWDFASEPGSGVCVSGLELKDPANSRFWGVLLCIALSFSGESETALHADQRVITRSRFRLGIGWRGGSGSGGGCRGLRALPGQRRARHGSRAEKRAKPARLLLLLPASVALDARSRGGGLAGLGRRTQRLLQR